MSNTDTETVVDPAIAAGDPAQTGDPGTQTEPAAEPQQRTVPLETFTREVTPLRARNRELEGVVEEHRRELAAARDLIAKFQNGGDPGTQPRQPDQPQITQADIDRRALELNFARDAQIISDAAGKTYGQQWLNSLNILGTFNLNTPDVVGAVMDIVGRDKVHEVMHEIGQSPELAASLASMSPVRKVAEITRIAERMNTKAGGGTKETQTAAATGQPPARTVSRAPAPPPRVDAAASAVVDWRSDKASDDEFSRGWEENMSKRRARR